MREPVEEAAEESDASEDVQDQGVDREDPESAQGRLGHQFSGGGPAGGASVIPDEADQPQQDEAADEPGERHRVPGRVGLPRHVARRCRQQVSGNGEGRAARRDQDDRRHVVTEPTVYRLAMLRGQHAHGDEERVHRQRLPQVLVGDVPHLTRRSGQVLVDDEHQELDRGPAGQHQPRSAAAPLEQPRDQREEQVDLHRDQQEVQLVLALADEEVVREARRHLTDRRERIVGDDDVVGDRVDQRPCQVGADDEPETTPPELPRRHLPTLHAQHEDVEGHRHEAVSGQVAQGADEIRAPDLVGTAVDGVDAVRDDHEGEQDDPDEVGGVRPTAGLGRWRGKGGLGGTGCRGVRRPFRAGRGLVVGGGCRS